MKRLHFPSALCLVLLSGGASLRAQAADHTPMPAVARADNRPTPILLNKEAPQALAGSFGAPNDAWITDPRRTKRDAIKSLTKSCCRGREKERKGQ